MKHTRAHSQSHSESCRVASCAHLKSSDRLQKIRRQTFTKIGIEKKNLDIANSYVCVDGIYSDTLTMRTELQTATWVFFDLRGTGLVQVRNESWIVLARAFT